MALKQNLNRVGLMIVSVIYSATAYADEDAYGASAGNINFGEFIEVLGITTLSCLIITVLLGIFMPKKRKLLFPWHKRFGFTTLFIGLLHGSFVLFFH